MDSFFKFTDSITHGPQFSRQHSCLFPVGMFGQWIKSRIDARFRHRTLHHAGGCDVNAIGNTQVAADHGGASDRTVLSEYGTAGNADTSGHRRIFANMAVVADLDLIVQFDAILDNRIRQCPSVDSGIGADLDIVSDNDASRLGNLEPNPSQPITAPGRNTPRSPIWHSCKNTTRGKKWQPAPIRAFFPIKQPASIKQFSPISAPDSTVTKGPTVALAAIFAVGSITALG